MKHATPAPVLRQARQHLLEYGTPLPGTVNERLARSWQRSVAAGLLPVGRLNTSDHAGSTELRNSLSRNHDLLAHSRPVMEYLFEQVRHIQSVVILADNQGMLMHTLGDPFFMTKAERVALSAGASWREEHRGTNAIGTAIAEESAVEIHGAEHFLERNGFLTCAAAPIMSASGHVAGILDISGEQNNGHPMTLGLVSTAARMIENRLLIASTQRHIRLHMHPQAEGIGTVAEGLLVLSEDGWIVGANRQALALLQLPAKAIGTTQLEGVLDLRLTDLLMRARRNRQQVAQIRRHDGSVLFVQVQAEAGVLPASTPISLDSVSQATPDALSALDTGDAKWRNAAEKARRVMDKPIPVLLQGESGVGKEYFARAMHDSSKRCSGPFVAINCAAIPENLIESELFGYAPGAFTGARKEGRLGKLREANGGTLFLDEIGDMPLALQSRLLRVLQERTVSPVGGNQTINLDFSLICATHCNLREASAQGRFRSDLYYRVNGITLQLPALRERTDFQELTGRLLTGFNPGREVQLAAGLLGQMSCYPWPGNLRQLASVLRTASAMLDDHETVIDFRHIADDMAEDLLRTMVPRPPVRPLQEPQNLQELSRYAVSQALEAARGNISLAARSLGISRQTLYRKLESEAGRPRQQN